MSIAMKLTKASITAESLDGIREKLLGFERIADIRMPGLSAERRPVIAGGLLVLDAAFAELGIQRMYVSDHALREGALFDLVGRASESDPRDASIRALSHRYGVDAAQAERVEKTALTLFDQAEAGWKLEPDDRRQLAWAAQIHELGLAIAHSQYHQHGAYLVEHSDIAGFSRTEQQILAALIRNQRRAVHLASFDKLPDRLVANAERCALLLRLAVLLHRSRDPVPLPSVRLDVDGDSLALHVGKRWMDVHPLTRADLDTEREYLAEVGRRLDLPSS
jgi:exopolyphosphatase/guanosine-5'-triphosphate,3'-diphosphate pyrophosphatase